MSRNTGKAAVAVASNPGPDEPRVPAPVTGTTGLVAGAPYRITYVVGVYQHRRVTHSIAHFEGEATRRRWAGDDVPCLDFTLPHGRKLSLLRDQLIEARAATQNDRGQWILSPEETERRHRRRDSRRRTAGQLSARAALRRAHNPLRLAG